ncbi:MAG: radical SAM protein [Asgard group archaeon]|nr:radical SAM protein [Asgard group archaeon]
MKKKIRALEGGSYIKGNLPEGCQICRKGAELFFLITGKCSEKCFYCSLSQNKRGSKLILANERPINNFAGVMLEIANMNALGAAITGGDPLICIDNTIDYITRMKQEYGKKFHVHLYTSGRYATDENLKRLFDAGLDEIRFHPQNEEQEKAIERALKFSWDVGAEIPVIPGQKEEIIRFLNYLDSLGKVKFCNLNELEATDSNIENLKSRNFEIKNENSAAIQGSEELALEILKEIDYKFNLHYCSSLTKDAVQFRNRLKRTAEIVKKPYEEIQDGMLVKAVFNVPKHFIPEEIIDVLIEEYEVDLELIHLTEDRKQIETSWFIADVLKDVLFERFDIEDVSILYQYPTFGQITIAKTSLRELELLEELEESNEED